MLESMQLYFYYYFSMRILAANYFADYELHVDCAKLVTSSATFAANDVNLSK